MCPALHQPGPAVLVVGGFGSSITQGKVGHGQPSSE